MTCVASTPGVVLAVMLVGQMIGLCILCSAFALWPRRPRPFLMATINRPTFEAKASPEREAAILKMARETAITQIGRRSIK